MLARTWRKGNPCALFMGMQICAATMKNSMEGPQKLKIELPFDPVIPLLDIYLKNSETLIQKNLCIPMFIAALFTTVNIWRKHKCPSVDEWIKNCGTFTQWNTMQQKERRSSYPLGQLG